MPFDSSRQSRYLMAKFAEDIVPTYARGMDRPRMGRQARDGFGEKDQQSGILQKFPWLLDQVVTEVPDAPPPPTIPPPTTPGSTSVSSISISREPPSVPSSSSSSSSSEAAPSSSSASEPSSSSPSSSSSSSSSSAGCNGELVDIRDDLNDPQWLSGRRELGVWTTFPPTVTGGDCCINECDRLILRMATSTWVEQKDTPNEITTTQYAVPCRQPDGRIDLMTAGLPASGTFSMCAGLVAEQDITDPGPLDPPPLYFNLYDQNSYDVREWGQVTSQGVPLLLIELSKIPVWIAPGLPLGAGIPFPYQADGDGRLGSPSSYWEIQEYTVTVTCDSLRMTGMWTRVVDGVVDQTFEADILWEIQRFPECAGLLLAGYPGTITYPGSFCVEVVAFLVGEGCSTTGDCSGFTPITDEELVVLLENGEDPPINSSVLRLSLQWCASGCGGGATQTLQNVIEIADAYMEETYGAEVEDCSLPFPCCTSVKMVVIAFHLLDDAITIKPVVLHTTSSFNCGA